MKRFDELPHQRKYKLKSRYNLDSQSYDSLVKRCDGACEICGTPFNTSVLHKGKEAHVCVDHCHDTHQVRGLLCDNCNKGLGHFGDNIDYLLNAIQYLNKNDPYYNS